MLLVVHVNGKEYMEVCRYMGLEVLNMVTQIIIHKSHLENGTTVHLAWMTEIVTCIAIVIQVCGSSSL